ncbi:MAG: ribbon-helix-helix domain-containing protein [Candidatus Hodarchaeales archaeon]
MLKQQSDVINQLTEEGFYPSISEVIRIAIMDYIMHIYDVTDDNNSLFWVDQTTLEKYSSHNAIKKSACTKMPINLLNLLNLITHQHNFGNRTNFIRLAVDRFLSLEGYLYSPWLSKNKSIQNIPQSASQTR